MISLTDQTVSTNRITTYKDSEMILSEHVLWSFSEWNLIGIIQLFPIDFYCVLYGK